MKGHGNDGKGNVPERDLWETKQELFNELHKQFNFTFDCCAILENAKCPEFSSDFEKQDIGSLHTCWMNPPFSNAFKMFETFFKKVKRGVAIYRCDNMETRVRQDVILKNAEWIFIPKGRVSYTSFEVGNMRNGNGTRFPSALIGVGIEAPQNIIGRVLYTKGE